MSTATDIRAQRDLARRSFVLVGPEEHVGVHGSNDIWPGDHLSITIRPLRERRLPPRHRRGTRSWYAPKWPLGPVLPGGRERPHETAHSDAGADGGRPADWHGAVAGGSVSSPEPTVRSRSDLTARST